MSGGELALVITASGGVIVAITGFTALFVNRKNPSEKDAHKSAIAVSQVTETKTQVDALVATIADLYTKISELQKGREEDQRRVAQLQEELNKEKDSHTETRRLLNEAKEGIAAKEREIAKLTDKLNAYIGKEVV